MWLKIVQCASEAAKILSQYGAEKRQRNSISVLVGLLCTLDSRLLSVDASRIFFGTSSTPRGSVGKIFPSDVPFFSVTVWLSWIFARLIGLKTLCSSVVSMGTSAARRPEACLTNCHTFSTLSLSFSHFWLRLDCSSVFLSSLSSSYFPFSVSLKPETSWLF